MTQLFKTGPNQDLYQTLMPIFHPTTLCSYFFVLKWFLSAQDHENNIESQQNYCIFLFKYQALNKNCLSSNNVLRHQWKMYKML